MTATVAPAELEGLLIDHKDVADAGVIGVWDEKQGTELPRWVAAAIRVILTHSAYIVPSRDAAANLTPANQAEYTKTVGDWIAGQVAPHKRLRGGIIVIESIPKSPSGKILRKDLRERAAKEWAKDARASL